ncbi:hypothetical protein BDF20DRAFT_881380 [Mycotypha africana]|uniref:uncharacterized protein n=1 Tax=Mycotypha africana TaxID=64632 RepID=UPI0022FFF9B5|nr:uncharacterized protein BDF20DRAFT_881380 [Mycotypha africana]KAI8973261.1 hypothetical protein BDF20DRAFT_881380 [Mycotypha africana]
MSMMYEQFSDEEKRIREWLSQEEASLECLAPMAASKLPLEGQESIPSHTLRGIEPFSVAPPSPPTLHVNNRSFYGGRLQQAAPIVGDTQLRSTSEIPPPFNSIFKFETFNVIQSKCLDDAFYENNNLVISAPTGSGKTVLMELAIIRTVLQKGSNCKIIYMAPTKSLCNERVKDWEQKFHTFGIKCKEFTGDTHNHTIASIKDTTIIVTTPEKWDSLTRRWIDHKQLMQLISLFLVDEVHILNEKRGACLETCVSRMKTMETSLRYMAVSATVPNLIDIATWLNAKPIAFSEEYRPIRLERFVYSYPQMDGNMFSFDQKLNWKLLDIIQKHSQEKPVLVFCGTRKSAEQACQAILKVMDNKNIQTLLSNENTPSTMNNPLKNKILPKMVERGIAFHHAGLDVTDRSIVEQLFLNKQVRVVATTSTLAVGVNFPAYLVIVKSTQGYQNGSLSEYSDVDMLQMMGRAGRPGLESSGCVVILTTTSMERRYKTLVSGTTNLESRLHENLIEHLLSEICLGTVTDEETAIKWLRSTFLFVRVSKNSIHYKLNSSATSADTILQEICVKNLELLEKSNLVQRAAYSKLTATPYGLAMDRYYLKFLTMINILEASNPASVRDTLELLSKSHEELDTVRFNAGEKQFLNTLKNHVNMRFPIDKVSTVADKIFLLVQCILGDIPLYNSGSSILLLEANTIIKHLSRITKCLIDCSVQARNPIKLKYAFELYQSIQAKRWSTSPYISRQIDGIGPQFAKALVQANLTTFEQLRNCDPGHLEMVLHRNPPFGIKIKKQINCIPDFFLNVTKIPQQSKRHPQSGNEILRLHIVLGLKNDEVIRGKHGRIYHAQFWVYTSHRELVDFRRIQLSKLQAKKQEFDLAVEIKVSDTVLYFQLQSEDIVGVDVKQEIKLVTNQHPFINSIESPYRKSLTNLADSNTVHHYADRSDTPFSLGQSASQQPQQQPLREKSLNVFVDRKRKEEEDKDHEFDFDDENDDIHINTQVLKELNDITNKKKASSLFESAKIAVQSERYNQRTKNINSNMTMGNDSSSRFNTKNQNASTSSQQISGTCQPQLNQEKSNNNNKTKAGNVSVLNEPCKHHCRDKQKCAHKCCKRHTITAADITPTTIAATNYKIGLKRINEDEEDSDSDNGCYDVTSDFSVHKRLKLSRCKNQQQKWANGGHTTDDDEEFLPALTNDELSVLNLNGIESNRVLNNSNDINISNINLSHGLKAREKVNFDPIDEFDGSFPFDQHLIDDINTSAFIDSTTKYNCSKKRQTLAVEPPMPPLSINNDNDSEDSIIEACDCDQLWENVGRIAQRAFENSQLVPGNGHSNLLKKTENDCGVVRKPFKSQTLAEWIEHNVEIIP